MVFSLLRIPLWKLTSLSYIQASEFRGRESHTVHTYPLMEVETGWKTPMLTCSPWFWERDRHLPSGEWHHSWKLGSWVFYMFISISRGEKRISIRFHRPSHFPIYPAPFPTPVAHNTHSVTHTPSHAHSQAYSHSLSHLWVPPPCCVNTCFQTERQADLRKQRGRWVKSCLLL